MLRLIGLVAGFIIAGAAGGLMTFVGLDYSGIQPPSCGTNECTKIKGASQCMQDSDVLRLYSLASVLLGGDASPPPGLVASLGLNNVKCVTVSDAASKVCAALKGGLSHTEKCATIVSSQ